MLNIDFLFLFLCLVTGYLAGRHHWVERENTGEARVRKALKKYCANRNAHLLNNVTLQLKGGGTTQIDHVLVSTKGIFVIETKHYKGKIYGYSKSYEWTQVTDKWENEFQNPLHQNYKHVKAIKKLLDFIKPENIHNIVVFTGTARFKTPIPKDVFYFKQLIDEIEKYPDDILSLNRVYFCVGRLECERLALTKKTDIEHSAYVNKKMGEC